MLWYTLPMFVIVGLGNPGEEYAKTRHNVGTIVLATIAKKREFSDWKLDGKGKSHIATGSIGNKKAAFLFPLTFMNNSGVAVKPYIASKKDLASLVVVHDDLDIPFGTIKISYNKSAGGHNGVESIVKAVKSQEFTRIRVGISPATPKGKLKRPDQKKILDFLVEKDFRDSELVELKKVAKQIDQALEVFIKEGREKAMNIFNTKK